MTDGAIEPVRKEESHPRSHSEMVFLDRFKPINQQIFLEHLYVPGTVPGAGDTSEQKTGKIPAPTRLPF